MSSSTASKEMGQKRSHSQMKAEDLKTQGNQFYNEERFEKAIQCYTEAILMNPNEPVYYTNRANAELK